MKRYDVRIAVWLAAAIMSYEKYHKVYKKRNPKLSDFYFRQRSIIARAEVIAIGKVHSARTSQWYNGDHENSEYNYLRSEGPLRRLTKSGEFNGKKERPMDLRLNNLLETEVGNVNVGELMNWVKTIYDSIGSHQKYKAEENSNQKKAEPTNSMDTQETKAEEISDRKSESLFLDKYLQEFSNHIKEGTIEIYNAFSFKYELGNHLKNVLPKNYVIEFERSITNFGITIGETIKKEMDIVIYNSKKNNKYCIALAYPKEHQMPIAMYAIVEDFKFLEQLKEHDFTECYQLTLIENKKFKVGTTKSGIYKYFRTDTPIHGEISVPTGRNDEKIYIEGHYQMFWENFDGNRDLSIVKV